MSISRNMAEDFPTMPWIPSQRDPISLYPLLLIPIVGLIIGAVLENEGIVSKSGPVAWVLFGLVILAIGVWIVLAEYNYLTYLRNEVEQRWHDIDVQFQRRAALIPEYSQLVERFLAHERNTLNSVMEARKQSQAAASRDAKVEAEEAVSGALSRLLAVVEAYPQITTQDNVAALQAELVNSENQIARFRLAYNSVTKFFNTVVDRIPTCVIAASFGVRKAAYAK